MAKVDLSKLPEFWQYAHEFQTLIGTIVGFFGVGLVANAAIGRHLKRYESSLEANRYLVALRAELNGIRIGMDARCRMMEGWKTKGPLSVIPLSTDVDDLAVVFHGNIGKLGLLTKDSIGPVVNTYVCQKQLRRTEDFARQAVAHAADNKLSRLDETLSLGLDSIFDGASSIREFSILAISALDAQEALQEKLSIPVRIWSWKLSWSKSEFARISRLWGRPTNSIS